jgi:hypothetical protein
MACRSMVQLGIVQGQQAAGGVYISKDQIRKDACAILVRFPSARCGGGGSAEVI